MHTKTSIAGTSGQMTDTEQRAAASALPSWLRRFWTTDGQPVLAERLPSRPVGMVDMLMGSEEEVSRLFGHMESASERSSGRRTPTLGARFESPV